MSGSEDTTLVEAAPTPPSRWRRLVLERVPHWQRYVGPVTVVGSGLVALIALVALPLVSTPEDGSVTGPELGAAGGLGWALLGTTAAAVAALVLTGGWLVATAGRGSPLRRRAALAVLAGAAVLAVGAAGLTVPHVLGTGAASAGVVPASLGAGWWLTLLGAAGVGLGAVATLRATPARTERAPGPWTCVRVAVSYALLLALLLGTWWIVVRDGTNWSAGLWGGLRGPTVTATCVLPPSKDSFGTQVDYDVRNVVDGRADTAWRCPGDGVGQELHVDLGRWTTVRTVSLLPGYAKTDPVDLTDRYAQNRRIAAVRYTFDGGATVEQRFDTSVANRSPQTLTVPAVQTRHLTITILDSVPGVAVGDVSPFDRVAISEVSVG